ncbi:MAG: patatin-like phospholipase family protein [Burkholderiaceae bacterium]|nr:patatin-like phospholipase family protein [Burkholderiaceae bacterium]
MHQRQRNGQKQTKSISLALQGGGSHGAFTWGVLDRILEDERITIEAISGTSAGAMNAVALADGLHRGGHEGARAALHNFWKSASEGAWLSLIQRTPWDRATGNWSLNNSPGYMMLDLISRLASPYELNPLNINPLKDFLTEHIDFEAVQHAALKLFIPATNVRTGRARVFTNEDLSPDIVMASACLPNMFPAVEIDGEAYWDGGYSGNPALHPLIYRCVGRDILIVQINPINVPEVPRTAQEIQDRINEITFNSSLLAELRAIRFVTRQLDEGHLHPAHYKQMLMHRIDGDVELKGLGASSKMNAEWDFLLMLHAKGREAASEWLDRHFDDIGVRSTLDLDALLA